jgi:hypothetical protein
MNNVVVLQSNYLPWKGYFDLIHDADTFIFYDDVQYSKNDWRNRNVVKAAGGPLWITVPVTGAGNRLICETKISHTAWQGKHWKTLQQNYQRCACFSEYREFLEHFYLSCVWTNLSQMNQHLIRHIATNFLGVQTDFRDSRDYSLSGRKQDRLLNLIRETKATRYISGPTARDYINPQRFTDAGVELVWKDYSRYPEYPQRFPPFQHGVSILDLLFNVGPDAPWYIWGWRENRAPI